MRTQEQLAKAEAYWNEAKRFVRKNSGDDEGWFVLTDGHQKQLAEWEDYFIWRLGFVSWGLKQFRDRKIKSFLVPAERPEWFDQNYAGHG